MEVKDLTYWAIRPYPFDVAQAEILAVGNLITPRRTVLGLQGYLQRTELSVEEMASLCAAAGLPWVALQASDTPITLEQELAVIGEVIPRLPPERSTLGHAVAQGLDANIHLFGVLGLALMYAESLVEAYQTILSFPELSWGHSRIVVRRTTDAVETSFYGDLPLEGRAAKRIASYCVTVDLAASISMLNGILGAPWSPLEAWLPTPEPADHRAIRQALGCPVRFGAPEARLRFAPEMLDAVPKLANPVVFRGYLKLASQLARVLRDGASSSFAEQVRRLLWIATPPPPRPEVASMLAVSIRTLARRLASEGTSYATLQREVQLTRARELLRDESKSMAEIGHQLGFSDATAFSRAFRQWTGVSPSAWRRAH